ncbi:MAG: hypothetical protein HFE59_05785 [Clostridiales bacterium]|nr:hypothetical protein [Clostridiales bacterium]
MSQREDDFYNGLHSDDFENSPYENIFNENEENLENIEKNLHTTESFEKAADEINGRIFENDIDYTAKKDIDENGISSLGYKVSPKFKRKNIKKAFRSVLQGGILIFLLAVILIVVFDWTEYVPVSKSEYVYDNGFITLSYFGVDRTRKSTLIDDDMLEKHLKALKDSGYVTISRQDITDYYKNGKKLPEKALYLVFEDGRRDSSLFAQPILEKFNFKASMMTYAEKFIKKDSKFLQPDDLKDMLENSFWELGTNGYRFQYINVFDRYGNFVGEIDQDQFNEIAEFMEDDYNHYLMDFIRDKDRISIENRGQMEERLVWDYNRMDELYKDNLGIVPKVYMIMHANGLDNDSNEIVRNVNFREAKKLFDIMYTREGESVSTRNNDIYNLTRMQVLPYWQTNHLLMRVRDDTGFDMSFVTGDKEKADKWEIEKGASEFEKNNIILTSPPNEEGLIRLKESGDYSDFEFSAVLKGNVLGQQTVYMRADEEKRNYISLRLKDNVIHIERRDNGNTREIKKFDLRETVDKPEPVSDDEMRKSAKVEEQKLEVDKVLYKDDEDAATEELKRRQDAEKNARSVEEGSEEYVPDFSVNDIGERLINVKIKGDTMSITVDNVIVDDDIKLGGGILKGHIELGAERSELNERDNVYDAVFEDLFIADIDDSENIIFDTRLSGQEKVNNYISENFEKVLDWFIETL